MVRDTVDNRKLESPNDRDKWQHVDVNEDWFAWIEELLAKSGQPYNGSIFLALTVC